MPSDWFRLVRQAGSQQNIGDAHAHYADALQALFFPLSHTKMKIIFTDLIAI